MSSIPEQIALATQTRLASQLTVVNALSKLAFGGLEKLIKLNFDTVKQSLEHSAASTEQWISAQDPQGFLSLSAVQSTPQLEDILSYGRELANISGLARAEFLQALGDLNPLVQFEKVGPDAVTIKVTAPKLSTPAITIQTTAEVNTGRKTPVAAPRTPAVAKKLKAKPKALKASDSQMSLLAGADKKVVAAAKTPAKAETANPLLVQAAATPEPALAAPVKATTAKRTVAKPAAKTGTTVAESKPLIEKSHTAELSTTPAPAKTVAEPVLEKKTAVKFPFPANPKKPGSKPSFPVGTGRPGYKAKGSAATGAKKPVRQ